jgi:hypothetical protein
MKIFHSSAVVLILGFRGDVFLELCYSPGFRRSKTLIGLLSILLLRALILKILVCVHCQTQHVKYWTCFGSYYSHLQVLSKHPNEHWSLHFGVGDTYCLRRLLKSWTEVVVKILVITDLGITMKPHNDHCTWCRWHMVSTSVLITDLDTMCPLHPSVVVRSNVCVRPEDGYNMSRNMSNIWRVVFDSVYLLNSETT